MKKIIYSFIVLLFAFNFASAQLVKADLQAAGLTCSMCSKATDKQLRTLDFIDSVDIDLGRATFILYFKTGKTVDFDKIKKKVQDAGFSVASLKVTYKVDNLTIDKGSSLAYQNMLFYFTDMKPQISKDAVVFKIVDKGFVSDKEYKKYLVQLNNQGDNKNANVRIYHVIL